MSTYSSASEIERFASDIRERIDQSDVEIICIEARVSDQFPEHHEYDPWEISYPPVDVLLSYRIPGQGKLYAAMNSGNDKETCTLDRFGKLTAQNSEDVDQLQQDFNIDVFAVAAMIRDIMSELSLIDAHPQAHVDALLRNLDDVKVSLLGVGEVTDAFLFDHLMDKTPPAGGVKK